MYSTNDLINWVDWLNNFCVMRVMDIHWSHQNFLFWVGIVWHRLSANQVVRYFKLKKLKNYMRYQVDFLLSLKLQKICYFDYATKYFWSISLDNFLLLNCLTCNLNTGDTLLDCICWFRNMCTGFGANHDDI